MKTTEWKLEDNIKTKDDLFEYMRAAIEENDFEFFIIACRDVLKISKEKGFYTKKDNSRRYYLLNKDRLLEKSRDWYKKHPKYNKEYGKKYREENKEKCRESNRKYREENKEHVKEYQRQYYLKRKAQRKGNKTKESRNF